MRLCCSRQPRVPYLIPGLHVALCCVLFPYPCASRQNGQRWLICAVTASSPDEAVEQNLTLWLCVLQIPDFVTKGWNGALVAGFQKPPREKKDSLRPTSQPLKKPAAEAALHKTAPLAAPALTAPAASPTSARTHSGAHSSHGEGGEDAAVAFSERFGLDSPSRPASAARRPPQHTNCRVRTNPSLCVSYTRQRQAPAAAPELSADSLLAGRTVDVGGAGQGRPRRTLGGGRPQSAPAQGMNRWAEDEDAQVGLPKPGASPPARAPGARRERPSSAAVNGTLRGQAQLIPYTNKRPWRAKPLGRMV